MKKIKVVQIGLGHDHATCILDSILRLDDIFEVVGFAVPSSEETVFKDKIDTYKNGRNVPKMTIDEALNYSCLDGAIIETEEVNLTKYAFMAAKNGVHIHMDKPGGLELSEFEQLIEAVKQKNLVFSTGYMYRFNPQIIQAMEKIKNGDIGEVYCVEAHMDCEHMPEKRQWLNRFPGGMMFFLGCHLIDLIYQIQGGPKKVIPMNMCTGFDGVTANDYGMALFEYPNGLSFAKTCANECGGFIRRQLVICGNKGTIEIKPLEMYIDGEPVKNQRTYMKETYLQEGWNSFGMDTKSNPYNRYDAMMSNFAHMVTGERKNRYSYDYELNLYKLLLRACGKDIGI